MTATEEDASLALRGYVISRTGCLPTDPAFQELSRNEALLQFTAHWLEKRESDLLDSVMRLLGTVWTREDVESMAKDSAGPPDRVFLPLALGCNAQLGEQLKEMFRVNKGPFVGQGEYVPAQGETLVELGDMPVEQFKQWASAATGAVASREAEPTVSLGSESNDPRLERMREQIAHSKRIR